MRKRTLINKSNIIVLIIFLSIFFLSIGYSAFSATGTIENAMATVRPKGEARITAVVFSSATNGGISESEADNSRKILGTIDLPNADSTVTYKVNATVFYAGEMKITSITGLPSNLEYTLTDYNIGDALCNSNNECSLGATDEFYITFSYANGGYNSASTTYNINLDVVFEQVEHVAKVGNTYYDTLQAAVNAVPNNTQTTVYLIANTSEKVTVGANKNIVFNFYNNTIKNKDNNPIIENNGTISISNGNFKSTASQAAINNNGTLYLSGGDFEITGNNSKQALYNSGSAYLSGNVTMSNTASNRAVVQNLSAGTMEISGGTYISNNYSALQNDGGSLVIGTQGGTPSKTDPIFRGKDYGVFSTNNYSMYDGILEGQSGATNDDNKITTIESGYDKINRNQIINNTTYDTLYLGHKITITFDANQGMCSEVSRDMESGEAIGALPVPIRTDYTFEGWYTALNNGTQVTASSTFASTTAIYAIWTYTPQTKVAKIDSTEYATFDEAWNVAMSSNTAKTIQLLTDISVTTKYTIPSSKGLVVDLNGHTLYYSDGTIFEVSNNATLELKDTSSGGILDAGKSAGSVQHPTVLNRGTTTISSGTYKSSKSHVIGNYGTMYITGGTFTLYNNVNQGVVNNNAGGTMYISGGTITNTAAIEKGQAVYNLGTLYISGNPTLNSNSQQRATVQNAETGAVMNISGGTITSTNANCTKGAVENGAGNTATITGGTIISSSTKSNTGAVTNGGTLYLGTDNGSINTSSPVLQGRTYGVNNSGTFNFYDGIIKGATASINGTVSAVEPNSNFVYDTETIGGVVYNTVILSF